MSWLNHTSSSVPENPFYLIVQWDKVTYKGYTAPTLKSQYAKVTGAHEQELTKWWDDIYDLSTAYYNDMSLQDLLANWNRNDGIVDNLSSLTMSGHDKDILNNRLHNLIWEANPILKERYDDFRLVADWTSTLKAGKQISVYNYGADKDRFDLNVHHIDISGDWIRDTYTLSSDGKVSYKNSITRENHEIMIEQQRRSKDLSQNYSVFFTTTPPDIYDPLHPEKGLQWSVKTDVQKLLDKLQKPNSNDE